MGGSFKKATLSELGTRYFSAPPAPLVLPLPCERLPSLVSLAEVQRSRDAPIVDAIPILVEILVLATR